MANTKVTTRVIADDAITSDKLASGLTLGGDTTLSGHVSLADGKVLRLGGSNDLQFFHDGTNSNSHIQNQTGALITTTATFVVNNAANTENMITAAQDGAVTLFHNHQAKLATASGGVTITGTATATTFAGELSGTITAATTGATQSASDNSTKVATTAYVTTAISNLIDNAPTALNTLNELAAALGDDANFSTTVTNSIATKMPIAGGTFTGSVTIGGSSSEDRSLIFALDGRASAFTGQNNSHIFSGQGGSGDFLAGALYLQSRSATAGREIGFITGTTPTKKLVLKADGQLLLGLTSSDVGFSTNAFELANNIRFRSGNFGIKANDGSYEHHLVRSVSGNNVYLANDKIQVGAATGFVNITGGTSTGLAVSGPIKTGGSGNYILFDYDGDFTGSNYYSIAETSSDKLRIARNFSSTDCIELDSSGNVAIQGGTLGVAGTITGTTLVSNDGNINGAPISAFKRTDQVASTADSGVWRSTSSYAYDATNGVRYYWVKVFTMPASNVRGVLEYQTKTDENYPQYSQGTIAFSSFNGGTSFSVQHDQSTVEGVNVTCRLDTSRALWLQFSAAWASNSRWRIFQFGTAVTEETSWTVGSNKIDPATTSVPPNSSGDIDPGKNIRATSSSVTGAIPSYTLYRKGNVQADKAIVDTDLTFNGVSPMQFNNSGSGTYNKTVVYHGQNNTANNVFSGLTVEMARLTDSSSAVTRNFTISDRGAVKRYSFSQFGLSFNETTAAAANSLDDYEEGAWTPVLHSSGGAVSASYSYRSAYYIKIGNQVFVRWGFRLSSRSGGGGTAEVTGLPFTSKNYGGYQQPAAFVNAQGLTTDPDGPVLFYLVDLNTKLQGRLMNNADTALPISYFQGGSWCIGNLTYDVS